MSDFAVEVVRITEPVIHHPNADRLSLVQIGGYTCISAKLEDGSHRYKQGDLVAYIPEASMLPEWLLRKMGFWDEVNNCGTLSGGQKNRVKAIRLRGIFSQGLLYPIEQHADDPIRGVLRNDRWGGHAVDKGDNVDWLLGITKYEPVIPEKMAGVQGALFGVTLKYDFESIQKNPTMFDLGEEVVATEKIHGTNIQIGLVPGCYEEGEDIYVTSKGLGARGFNLKDCPENDGNLYVRVLRQLREAGTLDAMRRLSSDHRHAPLRIFGEVFGAGVQDLAYGAKEPRLLVFDIKLGGDFLSHEGLVVISALLGLEMVPVLYRGPFDVEALKGHRDGKTVLGGGHIREGIVIRPAVEARHPRHGRKIAKWVSPDYLLRKNATEFA